MTKYYCDRCEKSVSALIQLHKLSMGGTVYELCKDCLEDVKELLATKPKEK